MSPHQVMATREPAAAFLERIALPLQLDATVFVNPNWVASAPPPVATSVEFVRDCIAWLQAKYRPRQIVVGDMPSNRWNSARGMMEQGDCESVFRELGALDLGNIPGVRVALFDREEWVRSRPPANGTWPEGIEIARSVLDADFVLKLIQLKTHWITGFSGAIKGLMGFIPLKGSRYIHGAPSSDLNLQIPVPGHPAVPPILRRRQDYCDRIAAIATVRRPDYYIVDARQIFAAEGPGKGPVVNPGWMAATSDMLSAELTCLSLLRWTWDRNLPTTEGLPIQDWYRDYGDTLPPYHNGRIDVLERFPLRCHPLLEAGLQLGLWRRAHEPVELQICEGTPADAELLAAAMGASLSQPSKV